MKWPSYIQMSTHYVKRNTQGRERCDKDPGKTGSREVMAGHSAWSCRHRGIVFEGVAPGV